jgi:hypothetical protein
LMLRAPQVAHIFACNTGAISARVKFSKKQSLQHPWNNFCVSFPHFGHTVLFIDFDTIVY